MSKKSKAKPIEDVRETSKVSDKYALFDVSLKAISNGNIPLLILKGSAGWGKSFRTKQYLEENKISHKYINTYSTPLAFYKILYEHKDKSVIIFDDLQVDDRKIIALMKGACNNIQKDREVMWNSTTEVLGKYGLPESFKLNSNIILILNDNLIGFKPILNRSIIINFEFNLKEKIEILNKFKKKAGIDNEIVQYIVQKCHNSMDNLSIRSAVLLTNLKNGGYDWEKFAQEMFEIDEDLELLCVKVQKCNDLKCACASWCAETGLSRRTFFNYYKKLGGKKYFKSIKKKKK